MDDLRKRHGIVPGTGPYFEGELPGDVEIVWGRGVVDASGQPTETTARILIGSWGLEVFRHSAIHLRALGSTSHKAKSRA